MSIEVIQKSRGEGKSHDLITWWLEDPEHRVVLYFSEQAARSATDDARHRVWDDLLWSEADRLCIIHLASRSFMSWDSAKRTLHGSRKTEVAFDQIDFLLRDYAGTLNVKAVTLDA